MNTSKIILSLLTAVILAGCRSSRPTGIYEVSADSLSVSVDKFLSVRKDSISISKESGSRINDTIEFVSGGGCVSVSSDGSVMMSGVANVKSSRLNSSVSNAESHSIELKYQSKDSVAETHSETIFSESRPKGSSGKYGIMLIAGITFFLMMIMLIAKNYRNKN